MPHFVEKIRVPVRLTAAGGTAMDGQLLVSSRAAYHDGPETLLESLNQPRRVIPFLRAIDGATLLLARDQIDWVAASGDVDETLVGPRPDFVTHEERVEVRLRGGGTWSGMLRMEMPPGLNRASDFLNGDGEFFGLWTRSGLVLINKSRMLQTRVFQSSPMPLESHTDAA